jgi:hypothetical protein
LSFTLCAPTGINGTLTVTVTFPVLLAVPEPTLVVEPSQKKSTTSPDRKFVPVAVNDDRGDPLDVDKVTVTAVELLTLIDFDAWTPVVTPLP